MLSFTGFIVLTYVTFVGGLYLFQRNLLYYPDASLSSPSAAGVAEMRAVKTFTEDGFSHTSWYAPAAQGLPTLVYFQGNAGNISDRGHKARPYLDAGLGVLLAGYRGYGGNGGSPTEVGLYADGRAALSFLKEQGINNGKIVLYGESLGSGVAVRIAWEMAKSLPAAAVVLEAPFTSMGDAAQYHYPYVPARWLLKDGYPSASLIADVKSPLLIVHGEQDRTVPFDFGVRLYERARPPKENRWVAGAGHNNLYDFGVAGAVVDFLKKTTGPQ